MKTSTLNRKTFTPLALASAIGLALTGMAIAQSEPERPPFPPPGQADRVAVASSSLELIEARQTEEGPVSEPVELLRTAFDVRSSNATDLVIRVDGECAAWTDAGEEEEEEDPIPDPEDLIPQQEEEEEPDETPRQVTGASVITWVELNGQPVSVSGGQNADFEIADDGTVVFCNAGGSLEFAGLEDDELIDHFDRSRTAGGFTWTVDNVGRGFHEVVVMAAIDLHSDPVEEDDDNGDNSNDNGNDNDENGNEEAAADALAIFGKRLMIVERARVAFADSFSETEL